MADMRTSVSRHSCRAKRLLDRRQWRKSVLSRRWRVEGKVGPLVRRPTAALSCPLSEQRFWFLLLEGRPYPAPGLPRGTGPRPTPSLTPWVLAAGPWLLQCSTVRTKARIVEGRDQRPIPEASLSHRAGRYCESHRLCTSRLPRGLVTQLLSRPGQKPSKINASHQICSLVPPW